MADDEQFSLCWNNFNTNLSAGFHESLVRGDLVDVTLAAEGQLVKAHRLILSVCSPYFRKMFTQMPANQHAFIFLKDVSHSALKDLIQFMYCGEVNVKQDALPAFISTAEALQIKGLTETGESAPTHPSPAKEASHIPSASSTTIPSLASSPRAKPIVRSRIQSYKLDSDDGSDHEKIVQIQATSTPASVASASSSTATTQVSVPQQVQILQQQTPQAQKRTLQQRASITPQTTQIMKRAKLTDPLEASEPTQIQTVQIVKQIAPTPQPSVSSEPEYVEMPIETINPKAEPEYADDPSEVEAIDTEHEQEQSLAEQEAAEHDQAEDDSAHYVEDETYGDMSKYDETYFAEGDDAKAGASGFSESYAESGTGADQAAQGNLLKITTMPIILKKIKIKRAKPKSPLKPVPEMNIPSDSPTVVRANPDQLLKHDNNIISKDNIVKQLSNGHALVLLKRTRVKGFCVSCIRSMQDPDYKKKLNKIITYCSGCPGGQWICEACFDANHHVTTN
ncbi:modifier of mdg4 isoform X21 [Aedes aegypti]|uniref:Uncharacterized protein n=1 Tax=Aedes aegypti TaxID=7159 RepID=A0A6I8TJU0_AEDAE|nr:modifier of mdg4 isoform X21 [Aedes aegypti]